TPTSVLQTKEDPMGANDLSRKDRLKIPRQSMPEQNPELRRSNFGEVNLGLPIIAAKQEALRCLQCASPSCVHGCPVGVNIKEFIDLVVSGDIMAAAAKIRESNVLPAVTGRVCPQENQCEGDCVLGNKFEPVGI